MISFKSIAALLFPILFSFSTYVHAVYLYNIAIDDKSVDTLKVLLAEPTTQELMVGELNIDRLSGKIKEIEIPLKPNMVVHSKLVSFEKTAKHASIWKGNIARVKTDGNVDSAFEKNPMNYVTLVQADNRITGIISIRGKIYSIRPLNKHQVAIITLDSSKFPEDGQPLIPSGANNVPVSPSAQATEPPVNQADVSKINVLMITTPETYQQIGAANYPGFVALASSLLQDSVTNSGLAIDYNVIDITTTISEGGRNMNTLLADLQNPSTPLGQFAAQQRDIARADLVNLMVVSNQYCGLANLLNGAVESFKAYGFSVVWHECASGDYTFGHEIGHNLGAQHDPANTTQGNPYFSYGYGYQHTGTPAWRTTMAYACSSITCPRINSFSSPSLFHNGIPMGTTTQDNKRVLEQTRHNASMVYPK